MTTLDAKYVAGLGNDHAGKIIFDSEETLRGFAVRVRHDHNGKLRKTWVMQYRIDGGQRRQKLGEFPKMTAAAARKKARTWREKIDEGTDPAGARKAERAAEAMKFRVGVEQFLERKKLEVRPETLRLITLYLTGPQYFGKLHKMPLSKITQSHVSTALDTLYVESGAPTASQAQKHLSAFFKWCLRRGHAPENPVAKTEKVKGGKGRDRVLNDDELRAVWNACQDDDLGKIIRLLILTGCREDEIGGLKWTEIDIERDTISLPGERTKNHRAHTLVLPEMAMDIIRSVEQRVSREHLFGSWSSKGFTSWAQKNKLGDGISERWVIHDLRRSVATGMADIGIEPHIIEAVLNHASGHKGGIHGICNRSTYSVQMPQALARWADHVQSVITGSERKVVAFPQQTA